MELLCLGSCCSLKQVESQPGTARDPADFSSVSFLLCGPFLLFTFSCRNSNARGLFVVAAPCTLGGRGGGWRPRLWLSWRLCRPLTAAPARDVSHPAQGSCAAGPFPPRFPGHRRDCSLSWGWCPWPGRAARTQVPAAVWRSGTEPRCWQQESSQPALQGADPASTSSSCAVLPAPRHVLRCRHCRHSLGSALQRGTRGMGRRR